MFLGSGRLAHTILDNYLESLKYDAIWLAYQSPKLNGAIPAVALARRLLIIVFGLGSVLY